MKKEYIIFCIKHSTKEESTFWRANDSGYTTNPWQAGIYSEDQIKAHPSYYNDGLDNVAICINNSSLKDSGLTIAMDVKKLKNYRTNNRGDI